MPRKKTPPKKVKARIPVSVDLHAGGKVEVFVMENRDCSKWSKKEKKKVEQDLAEEVGIANLVYWVEVELDVPVPQPIHEPKTVKGKAAKA